MNDPQAAPAWREVEVTLTGPTGTNPYLEVDAWVDFLHSDGTTVSRPVFWDGGRRYAVRFASPRGTGAWTWSVRSGSGHRFTPDRGTLTATVPAEPHPHPAFNRGFATPHPAGRTLRYADGSPCFLVIDTAWAMPFRAQPEEVADYAADRQAKGFNACLLMTVQPDMGARGPAERGVDEGFAVGFADLPDGHLTLLDPAYFADLDRIVDTLLDHGITPILQPVFHGFGWKGLGVAGPVVPPAEYARYCRYLVARYGARPVVYLPGGDCAGTEPQVEAGGRMIHAEDAYGQPTGIHYRPHARNAEHQSAAWLDFQSCQTGHAGDHVPERVATMWTHQPVKAVMNGEPTYENSGRPGVGGGWWQGHEAWSNLCAGALLGVGYGAGSLWQWRLHAGEPGHEPYFLAERAGWREALAFEGSRYVGLLGRILEGLPIAHAKPCWDVSGTTRGLLDPAVLYLGYAEHGGPWMFLDADGRVPSRYWLIDPRSGRILKSGPRPPNRVPIEDRWDRPRVLICAETTPAIAERR